MTTTFKPYPKYKPSGVEWLGDIPEHWESRRLKHIFFEKPYVNGASLPAGAISFGEVVFKSEEKLTAETKSSYQEVLSGEFLVNPINLNYDLKSLRTAISTINTCVSSAYIVLKMRSEDLADPNYLKLMLHIFDVHHMKTLGAGVRQTINFSDIGTCITHLPPVKEQAAIAKFLDSETAKIDETIKELEASVELLNEEKTSLINEYVTGKINPETGKPYPKYKPSGVEWLGEIPEHWEVTRINPVADKITNGYVGPTRDIFVEDGVRYLQSLHIKNNKIVFGNDYYVSAEWSNAHGKSILREGDVLIVQTGDVGQAAVVPKEFEGCNCHALIIVSPTPRRLSGPFLSWFLQSSIGFYELKRIQTGALHPHLNCRFVKNVSFPLPPLSEQIDVAKFLNASTDGFIALIAEKESLIETLKEYRTSLIHEAVTGKIDLRNA